MNDERVDDDRKIILNYLTNKNKNLIEEWHEVKQKLNGISSDYNKYKTKTETLNEDNQFLVNKINETENNIAKLQSTLEKASQGLYHSQSNFNTGNKNEKVSNYMLARNEDQKELKDPKILRSYNASIKNEDNELVVFKKVVDS